jgi:triosephosphate isomerase
MKPFFGANWKMNGTWPTGMSWLLTAKSLARPDEPAEMVLFPPFTLMTALAEDAREAGLQIGAQDVYFEKSGAFTGEISPAMILESGCSWVIVGHSERRHVLGEANRMIKRKLEAALEAGLGVVLCVGELGSQRDSGEAEKTVTGQLDAALPSDLSIPPWKLVIAYEPVWAIGTGKIATPAEACEMHGVIRGWLGKGQGVPANTVRVIYGGSVKPENSTSILGQPDVDGALVGGASLDAASFFSIVRSVTG